MKLIHALSVLLMIVLLMIPLAVGAPDEAAGRAILLTDGDTFDVLLDYNDRISEEVIRVRLADLDAPEMYVSRACEAGEVAIAYTRSWLLNNLVNLDIYDKNGKDDYGRWMAACYLEDGRNFNRMSIDSGNAAMKDFSNNEFHAEDWWGEEDPSGASQDEAEAKSWWQFRRRD